MKINSCELAFARPLLALVAATFILGVNFACDATPPAVKAAAPAPKKAPAQPAPKKGEEEAKKPVAAKPAAKKVAADPLDWPVWRGPEYNGVSRETGLPDEWDPEGGEGSNLKWKKADVGSRSTPIVMRGKLYFLARAEPGTDREGERVVCLNAETGDQIWENRFNVWLSDVPDTRVAWSSVVGDPETGNVYALGVCGKFMCIDGESGKTIWSVPMHERFGLLSTYGGRTNYPVVCDDLVIISAVMINWGEAARPTHRFIGFNKLTGDVVWFGGTRPLPEDTTYSMPTLCVLKGQKALVFGSGDGWVYAIQPRTGKQIWEFHLSRRGINTGPLVVGDQVFAGHSEENVVGSAMGAVALLDGSLQGNITKSGEVWRNEEQVMVGRASPLLIEDRLYCLDDAAKLVVLDAKSGDPIGKRITLGTMQRACPLYADGKIYIAEANGRLYIMEPDEKAGAKFVGKKLRLPEGEEMHASPICSHGRIYLMSTGHLYCFEDEKKMHKATPIPEQPVEESAGSDNKPAQVQVVPAEVLMQPGKTQKFTVRLFNKRGQFLKESAAKFELKGPGEISTDGEFKAAMSNEHTATILTAKAGDLTGRARIRVVPPFPWKFDFDSATDAPLTWVGARYRHVIREVDGGKVLVKITTIPKGTRSRSWMGPSELHDYTIQADVRGALADGKTPDIGLIAQGYECDLQGANQKLQIRSWVSHDFRVQKTIDFPWKPNTWYTMKLRAANEDGKAVVQAKVWPKDEKEPEAWQVEIADPAPNTEGSPGLFGNAKDAEIFLDNITVTAN